MLKLSTADPIPASSIDVDGVEHAVWNYYDVPNGGMDAYLRLRGDAENLLDDEHLIGHPELMLAFIEFHAPTIPKETLAKLAERPLKLHSTYVALLGVAQADPLILAAARAAMRKRATAAATASTSTDSAPSSPATSDGATPSPSESPFDKASPTSTPTKGSGRRTRST